MISMVESSSLVCSRSGNATFSPTVIEPNNAPPWKDIPIFFWISSISRDEIAAIFYPLPFTHEEKECRKDEVHQYHQKYGNHNGARGGSADLLRACTRGKPFVTSHGRDRYPEHNALD